MNKDKTTDPTPDTGGEGKWKLLKKSDFENAQEFYHACWLHAAEQLDETMQENERLKAELSLLKEQSAETMERLNEGCNYLMGVQPGKLTVEDALEAFGFGRNGLRV